MIAKNAEVRCSVWRVYLEPASLRMLFFGFGAGLPLLLVLGTLGFWLKEAGVELRTIGFLSWIGLIYGFKWTWAPLVDRMPIPWLTRVLGRRRAWLLAAQCLLVCGIAGMAFSDPAQHLERTAFFAVLTAFASATQDIALDAYRIESVSEERQAALAAMYQTGYRLGMIWAGAGALALAAWAAHDEAGYLQSAWQMSYLVMAASVAVGLLSTLLAPEAKNSTVRTALQPDALKQTFWTRLAASLIAPVADFFRRYGRSALLVLLLIATYRISDVVMGVMANPFYQEVGFSKAQVAAVSKVFGVLMTLAGAFLGGVAVMKFGVLRTLMAGAVLSSATNLLFSVLAEIGPDVMFLMAAVSADNLAAGLSSAAFLAYMSGLTSRGYSATQYALFSSLMLLLPKFFAGFSGLLVEAVGFSGFFVLTAAAGVPVFLLVWLVRRYVGEVQHSA